MPDESGAPIEQVIADLRKLADEAGEDVEKRKAETDLSDANPSQMALSEMQGQRNAFQQAWSLAISKREEIPEDDS